MKKWLLLPGLLAAGFLLRLPHPARDIARLEPVRAVYLYMEQGLTTIETDTDTTGTGPDLESAYAALRNKAHREIFLDTAQFLILDPDVPITEPVFEIFRPDCKVVITDSRADLKKSSDYLSQHPPKRNLAQIRAERTQPSALSPQHSVLSTQPSARNPKGARHEE